MRAHEFDQPGAAGCIIVAEDTGRWCFQQRSDSVSDPGVWAAWGGGREPGESIEQTVRRELAEEGGYRGPIKLEHLHTSPRYITFIGRVPHEFEPRLNYESKDYCWVNPGEWPEPLHPGVAKSLKKQSVSESRIEVVDVESIHNEGLRKHLLANPELYENTEDFKSIRNFLNTHKTPVPTPGKKYVYASVQSTPMARYISIAHFDNNHKLIRLDGNYAYFDVDGKIKKFPESGTLSGDSLSQIYFFNSLSDFEKFDLLLKLKFSDHKKISKVLDRDDVAENFADGKVKGKSRPGRVKRAGASCKGSVTDLRAKAKKYGGERGRMYHWCANMKGGKKK